MSRRVTIASLQERIAYLESRFYPYQALWSYQHNPKSRSESFGFSVPPSDTSSGTVDVRVTLWIGARRHGMVVCEASFTQRPDGGGTHFEPIWNEPAFVYELAKQWEASGNAYYQHAAIKLRAIEVSMYERAAPIDYRYNVTPDIELSTGAIVRHERIAQDAQRAFIVGSDREMTSDEWNEYCKLTRMKRSEDRTSEG